MITVNDIRNPKRKSGFDHVQSHGGKTVRPSRKWRAIAYGGHKDSSGRAWYGHTREKPIEAAQDYCDYVNGQNVKQPVALASATHPRRPSAPSAKRKRRPRPTKPDGFVYCIGEAGRSFAVKVGYSDHEVGRLGELQTGNPRVLVLHGQIKGTRQDERELHGRFAADNVLGEWFKPTPELLAEFDLEMDDLA